MLSDLGKRPELSKHKFNARINKEKDCLHRNILHTDVKLHTHVTHIFQRKQKKNEKKESKLRKYMQQIREIEDQCSCKELIQIIKKNTKIPIEKWVKGMSRCYTAGKTYV